MSLEETRRHQNERRRNILYLIAQYLSDFGLQASLESLCKEAHLLPDYQVCDNVDLDTIYLDYCSYYQLKFSKQPKIIKKVDLNENGANKQKTGNGKRRGVPNCGSTEKGSREEMPISNCDRLSNAITVSAMKKSLNSDIGSTDDDKSKLDFTQSVGYFQNCHPEFKEMSEFLYRDIVQNDFAIKWDSIQGNADTKKLLYDSVVMPLNYPQLFQGTIKPWRGILMHGPPGTGKTLMARALCSETLGKVTFFNVSSSTVTSKWRGDSEKFVRILFEMAKFYAPSVIFIDEIESLASKRDAPNEHEASRRFKNEFLTQIDGLDYMGSNVLLLVNSNLPWEIDVAFLRRFERKILVDLPKPKDRVLIIQHFLPESQNWTSDEKNELSEITVGLTGADIKIACKAASLKKIQKAIDGRKGDLTMQIEGVTAKDLKLSLALIKPTMSSLQLKHQDWNKNFGTSLNA